jgi:alkylation response protein AidB-like acyl-CoA dehydrogenase
VRRLTINAVLGELDAFLDARLSQWQADWRGDLDDWEARCAWQRILSEDRWSAPSWPVEYGGRALNTLDALAVGQRMSDRGVPRAPGILGLKNVGPTLLAWGTAEQKGHLPAILSTDEIWCQGFSEPSAGSDLAGLSTRAVRDGDNFVVNGQKIWTSAGLQATHMQLLARTDPDAPKHRGISCLLVDMGSPGIEVRPIRQINGEATFAEVFFTDVRVPAANLLGALNQGWTVTMTTLSHERAGVALFAAQLEKQAREAVRDAARGRPLGAIDQDKLLACYVESRIVGMLGREMLGRLAGGEEPGAAQSIIKLVWSEASQRLDDTLADIAGPELISGGAPGIAKAYLSARAATIAAGTSQIVRNILAERVLELPR